MMKSILTIALGLLFFVFPPSNVWAQAEAGTIAETKSKTITVKVKGVGCSKDVKSIALSVKKLSGVTSCDVGKKGATTSYNVTYDPSAVSQNQIESAIEETPGCKNPNDRPYKVKN